MFTVLILNNDVNHHLFMQVKGLSVKLSKAVINFWWVLSSKNNISYLFLQKKNNW